MTKFSLLWLNLAKVTAIFQLPMLKRSFFFPIASRQSNRPCHLKIQYILSDSFFAFVFLAVSFFCQWPSEKWWLVIRMNVSTAAILPKNGTLD